jgi:hypothetical protein
MRVVNWHRSLHTLVAYLPEPTQGQAYLATESKRCQSDPVHIELKRAIWPDVDPCLGRRVAPPHRRLRIGVVALKANRRGIRGQST